MCKIQLFINRINRAPTVMVAGVVKEILHNNISALTGCWRGKQSMILYRRPL